jgi:hypothetical protein
MAFPRDLSEDAAYAVLSVAEKGGRLGYLPQTKSERVASKEAARAGYLTASTSKGRYKLAAKGAAFVPAQNERTQRRRSDFERMGIPRTVGEMSARDVKRMVAYHREGHAVGTSAEERSALELIQRLGSVEKAAEEAAYYSNYAKKDGWYEGGVYWGRVAHLLRGGHAGGHAGGTSLAARRAEHVDLRAHLGYRGEGPITSDMLIRRARMIVDTGEVSESAVAAALHDELTERGMYVPSSDLELRRKYSGRLLAMGTDDRGRPRRGGPFGIY